MSQRLPHYEHLIPNGQYPFTQVHSNRPSYHVFPALEIHPPPLKINTINHNSSAVQSNDSESHSRYILGCAILRIRRRRQLIPHKLPARRRIECLLLRRLLLVLGFQHIILHDRRRMRGAQLSSEVRRPYDAGVQGPLEEGGGISTTSYHG